MKDKLIDIFGNIITGLGFLLASVFCISVTTILARFAWILLFAEACIKTR
jgi:hypothetical protein